MSESPRQDIEQVTDELREIATRLTVISRKYSNHRRRAVIAARDIIPAILEILEHV